MNHVKRKPPVGKVIKFPETKAVTIPEENLVKLPDPKNIKLAEQSIAVYADFGCTSGFGNVAKELVDHWSKKLTKTQITVFAVNCHELLPYDYNEKVTVWPLHLSEPHESVDVHCRSAFVNTIMEIKLDVIFMLQDLEVMSPIAEHLQTMIDYKKANNFTIPKLVYYFPVDSPPMIDDTKVLDVMDEIITYTQYGKKQITNLRPDLTQSVQVVPHGVDTRKFHRLPKAQALKQKFKMFGANKFVLGSVNRNSARKDVATTLLAFQRFKNQEGSDGEDIVLYLHMNPTDPFGANLPALCQRLGLQLGKDVFFPAFFSENKGFSESDLNLIYNTFDLFITTTTAEGWGLTVTEAMACQVPVICPTHTSLKEISANGARAITIDDFEEVIFLNDGEKIRYKSRLDNVIDALHTGYYQDTSDQILLAKEYVNGLTWEKSAQAIWENILKHLKKTP